MTAKEQRGIDYLRRVQSQLHRYAYKELLIDLYQYMPSLPISLLELDKFHRIRYKDPFVNDPTIIYRARENITHIPTKATMKLPFKTVDEISIISESNLHKIEKFGRCNKPKSPRFYASNYYPTSSIEVITNGFTKGISESKTVTVGLWKIVAPLVLNQINYSEKALQEFHTSDPGRYDQIIDNCRWLNSQNLKLLNEDSAFSKEYAAALLEIFAEEFAKIEINGDYDYMLSNYYCDHVFEHTVLDDGKTMVDGILYPSASFSYQEWNLVLHPRAMHKIKFIDAMQVWVVHDGDNLKTQFVPLEQNVGADASGKINWRNFAW